jgi:hypothetical protein
VDIAAFTALVSQLDHVAVRSRGGALDCRYRGRLVARQIGPDHVVIRISFELREEMLRLFPDTFTVPPRYAKHMMVVADLGGDAGAIEDAVVAAWRLQVEHDS